MKIEKLTNEKIKIILSKDDINKVDISINDFLDDKDVSQNILNYILEKAEKEINFNTENSDILVEIITKFEGGFIFTITKFNSENDNSNISNLIFKFDNFENFLEFCRYIKNFSQIKEQDFSLILYKNEYYLSIFNIFAFKIDFYSILCEFAEPIELTSGLVGTLNEYGKTIFERKTFKENIEYFI